MSLPPPHLPDNPTQEGYLCVSAEYEGRRAWHQPDCCGHSESLTLNIAQH